MINSFILDKEDYNDLVCGDSTEKFSVVKEGNWVSEGKWETKEVIFKDDETGKFYSINGMRSGSYYSDYEYEDDLEAVEVEAVKKVITVWRVKDGE